MDFFLRALLAHVLKNLFLNIKLTQVLKYLLLYEYLSKWVEAGTDLGGQPNVYPYISYLLFLFTVFTRGRWVVKSGPNFVYVNIETQFSRDLFLNTCLHKFRWFSLWIFACTSFEGFLFGSFFSHNFRRMSFWIFCLHNFQRISF